MLEDCQGGPYGDDEGDHNDDGDDTLGCPALNEIESGEYGT
jgi:hypothetical protein